MPGLGACSHPGATLSATCPGGVVLQCTDHGDVQRTPSSLTALAR
jgi:hypothetical protein